ncbi:protein SICKLE-like [Lycium ferocissimum]|uniref:protein SICKLE-like n=1 Tax=Lycium ferocissimum TaxID=112874 RepID=UPI002814A0BC|nr:protein SICKLE-like [Lycium ferocissimum]XP_059279608.1 protein SICKLE-like [Lycium ferocissimum]XP_059279609.1 protein SICKLE-like [Lycium ferocissimum]
MEESEKRKERLKAIREEAAEAGDNAEEQNSIVHGLANPLIESPSASSGQDEPRPRFDYYTDPMAAFSANNKKNNVSPHVSQSFNSPPRPMNAGSPAYHAQGNYNSAPRTYRPRGVNATPLGIRRKTSPFCTPLGNSSNTLDSCLDTPNSYPPPNSPQIGDISSDGFPQGGGAGSPYQGSGSKGRPYRGSRGGGGRFKFYYHKSMVEDPWKALKPVIWKPHGDTRDYTKSWLQNSISTKKAKLGETPTKSTPGESLAEYLAAAFSEAIGEDIVNNESGT